MTATSFEAEQCTTQPEHFASQLFLTLRPEQTRVHRVWLEAIQSKAQDATTGDTTADMATTDTDDR